MKHSALKTALLATSVAALVNLSASAQTALSYSNGQLLLGFTDPNVSTSSYVLDLGSISQFTSGGAPFTVNLGGSASGINTDLNGLFGNWATDGTLSWGGAATNAAGNSIFLTDQNPGAPGSANDFNDISAGSINVTVGKIITLGAGYATTNGQTNFSTGNSTVGFIQGTGAGTFAGDNAFQFGSPTTSFGLSASVLAQDGNDTSITNTTLELEGVNPASGGPDLATNFGTFSISDTGGPVVTFTPAAVPEPSSIALLGLGLAGFAFRRRRTA